MHLKLNVKVLGYGTLQTHQHALTLLSSVDCHYCNKYSLQTNHFPRMTTLHSLQVLYFEILQ